MVTNQINLFLLFILNGLLIGLFFDFFRILRKSFKTNDFITYIEDMIFWIVTGLSILYFIFVFNNGEIRFYMFLGIILGVTIYMFLFSSYIIKINVTIINFLKSIIEKIVSILLIPLKLLFKIIKKIFYKPISFVFINFNKSSTNFYKKINKLIKSNKKEKNNSKKIKI